MSSWYPESNQTYWQYLQTKSHHQDLVASQRAAAGSIVQTLSRENVKLLGSVRSLEHSLESSIGKLGAVFEWGFSELFFKVEGLQASLDELVAIAKTPAQTAAYEQFEVARDAYRRGLFPECLEYLSKAIEHHKIDWRFHYLQGLVQIGSFRTTSEAVLDPQSAEQAFLLAARYSQSSSKAEAARALLSAGWAAYIQAANAPSKISDAARHTNESLRLAAEPFGLFQAAKIAMAANDTETGLDLATEVINEDPAYAVKVLADGDFQKHGDLVATQFEKLRKQKLSKLQGEIPELVSDLETLAARLDPLSFDEVCYAAAGILGRWRDQASTLSDLGLVEILNYEIADLPEEVAEAWESVNSGIVRKLDELADRLLEERASCVVHTRPGFLARVNDNQRKVFTIGFVLGFAAPFAVFIFAEERGIRLPEPPWAAMCILNPCVFPVIVGWLTVFGAKALATAMRSAKERRADALTRQAKKRKEAAWREVVREIDRLKSVLRKAGDMAAAKTHRRLYLGEEEGDEGRRVWEWMRHGGGEGSDRQRWAR